MINSSNNLKTGWQWWVRHTTMFVLLIFLFHSMMMNLNAAKLAAKNPDY
jgi:hypothetical protein